MTFEEIKELIKLVSKTGIGKVQVEKEDFKVTISGSRPASEQPIIVQSPQPAISVPSSVPASAEAQPESQKTKEKDEDDGLVTIKSTMIGTFYRSPGPEKEPFMNVGSTFSVGDTLCVIEAMKTFNEIEAEITGKIVKVLVDDASPVDYEQPLFLIEPA
jgi:acetyl-CoA carboxylase biotin carboxyl carrier protein